MHITGFAMLIALALKIVMYNKHKHKKAYLNPLLERARISYMAEGHVVRKKIVQY
jgi:hypothetical protein